MLRQGPKQRLSSAILAAYAFAPILSLPSCSLAGEEGIEPSPSVLETAALTSTLFPVRSAPEGIEPSRHSKPLHPTERTRPAPSPLGYDAVWQDRQDSNLDTRFWRPLLYRLSYAPVWWSLLESNQVQTVMSRLLDLRAKGPQCRLFRLSRLVFMASTSEEVSRYSGATEGNRTLVPGLEDRCTAVVRLRHIYREWPAPGIVSFHCHLRGLWRNHSLPLAGLEPATNVPHPGTALPIELQGPIYPVFPGICEIIGFSRLPAAK